MDADNLFETVKRNAVDIFSEEGLRMRFACGKPLKIKFGADPSRPDLHLGHSVPLRMLRKLQDAGHEIIFVIGDFTGMIGDPSGRSKTRTQLSFEQTRQNGNSYFQQVSKIFDPQKARITYNSQWLSKLNFADILNLAGKYTLARIMERGDFASRYSANQPIGIHELLYPLMQGYDSIALNADIEVGGTDQIFNLLVGRELQKNYGQSPQEAITFPLLPGLDGKNKMSKSLNNYIGIDEPADIIFEKCMKVPDNILPDYFRLTTDMLENDYTKIINDDIWQAHLVYAREIVRMYHGEICVSQAEEHYRAVANKKAPDSIKVYTINNEEQIIRLLVLTELAGTNSESRRLINEGGIKIDGKTIIDSALIINKNCVISRGKNKYIKIHFNKEN
ncbi:tyrosyl-tRNA synthetase [Treponema sp. R8-4-B8]